MSRPKTYRRCEYPVYNTWNEVDRMGYGYLIGVFQGNNGQEPCVWAIVEQEDGQIKRFDPEEIKIVYAKA